jgi:TolB protein
MGPWIDGPADGLYVTDLASGNTSRLPGTQTGDLNPLWSPDGTEIAFTRGPSSGLAAAPGPYTVVVMDADGSNLRQLTDAAGVNYAVAWMPDGDHLLYNTPTRDGVALYNMDLQTGESGFLFESSNNGGVAVSPDGKRLVFNERSPLDKFGLFISNLDGSDRIQLADGDPYLATVSTWSPDGKWLIASIHDPNMSSQPNPNLALVGVESCQIIPLPNLQGYVFSWQP